MIGTMLIGGGIGAGMNIGAGGIVIIAGWDRGGVELLTA